MFQKFKYFKFNSKIKKLENILTQSISLVNRLIILPTSNAIQLPEEDKDLTNISQSMLYLHLIKFLNHQTNFTLSESITESDSDLINKNNQFIVQLNLLMSKAASKSAINSILDKSEVNWFHLLIKISIYKSNRILDCLLFSIFKKVSQLTPGLFGCLLDPFGDKMHSIILNKLNSAKDGQIVTIISDFLCSLIENQPGFFQKLACIKIEPRPAPTTATASVPAVKSEKFIEGEKSVLKSIFKLLTELKNQKNKVTLKFIKKKPFPNKILV